MRRDELVRVLRPHEVADLPSSSALSPHNTRHTTTYLTPRINLTQQRPRQRIPEPNLHIGRPSATREDPMLMRVPANRLDRGDMLRKPVQWRIPHLVPHEQLVVVPAARELVLGHVPLEAADFLSVPRELGDVVRGDPDVAVVDEAVVRAPSARRC